MNKEVLAIVWIVSCIIGLHFSPLLLSCDISISPTKETMFFFFLMLDFAQENKEEVSVLSLSISLEVSYVRLCPCASANTMSRMLSG